eukprot:TRINITY_DN5896_c0_g1_i1.p1 TRINITY_DN5896_c0_g1~~TRINITY_DN5896_c0_g1_i1.p1  ORF type:complete len:363 (+),score=42.37 TRINITY_DN5896_c0_g1_i1:350-1438(+)
MTAPFAVPGNQTSNGNSVGSIFNPFGSPHGCPENNTGNEGTLGNWQAAGGVISESRFLSNIVLSGDGSVIGRSVVIHELADDCMNSSSSGGRLGFGVVGISRVTTGSNTAVGGTAAFNEATCVLQGTASCQGSYCALGTAGIVKLTQTVGGSLHVSAQVAGISTERGFHIHSFGDLRSTDGTSAGSHYNPDGATHGLPGVTTVRHAGDLGSIRNFDASFGYYDYTVDYQNVASQHIMKLVGRGIVVHALLDHGSDPSCGAEANTTGAAGKRDYFCVIGYANSVSQSLPADFLPSPEMPGGFVMNTTWENVPCSSASPASAPSPSTNPPTNPPTTPPSNPPSSASSLLFPLLLGILVLFVGSF